MVTGKSKARRSGSVTWATIRSRPSSDVSPRARACFALDADLGVERRSRVWRNEGLSGDNLHRRTWQPLGNHRTERERKDYTLSTDYRRSTADGRDPCSTARDSACVNLTIPQLRLRADDFG